jgi:hypothetical protein
LFGNVVNWPSINDLLESQSHQLFVDLGIPAWQGMGGLVGADGRLGFGPYSSAALRISRQLFARSSGFRWDDGAATWAVRPLIRDGLRSHRLAYAVSFQRSAHLLDARYRADLANDLDERLAQGSRPGRMWDAVDRAIDIKLRRCSRQIHNADDAERCLLYLSRESHRAYRRTVLISSGSLAAFLWRGPENSRPNGGTSEVAARLQAVMDFQLALVRFGDSGWEPSILARSSAVSSVAQQSPDIFQVCVSPWLAKALDAFAQGTGAENPGVLA